MHKLQVLHIQVYIFLVKIFNHLFNLQWKLMCSMRLTGLAIQFHRVNYYAAISVKLDLVSIIGPLAISKSNTTLDDGTSRLPAVAERVVKFISAMFSIMNRLASITASVTDGLFTGAAGCSTDLGMLLTVANACFGKANLF